LLGCKKGVKAPQKYLLHKIIIMKSEINPKNGLCRASSFLNSLVVCVMFSALFIVGSLSSAQAQSPLFTKPSWYVGAAVGGNFNLYSGSTQVLHSGFTSPVEFTKGFGVGLYAAPLVEFHRPNTLLGFMFQAGYDNRMGKFKQQTVMPCNCPGDLSANLGYFTFEPSLRIAPFKSNFYIFAGPRFAINLQNSFVYKQGKNPSLPDQIAIPDVKLNFSETEEYLLSMQVGMGVDIPISSQDRMMQAVLSPFISYHPSVGQNPRGIESWKVNTLRAGIAIKIGHGKRNPSDGSAPSAMVVSDPFYRFTVNAPRNIATERSIRETFPLRNYIFFDLGSTEIPNRYVLLEKSQVKDFKEDQLEMFTPKNYNGRSDRQMLVYYNVINILADRMNKNPSAKINLVGSSEKGIEDGRAMAQTVKTYMETIFGINSNRITIEGTEKPKLPSEKQSSTTDLAMLRAGDRRVSVESNSPEMLTEFQTGKGAQLKPVQITAIQTAPFDSYVTFNVEGAKTAFDSWSLEVVDDKGKMQKLGPYTQEKVSIPGKTLMGTRPEGTYKITMVGQTKNGKVIRKEATTNMVLWTPPKESETKRFSVIFEFDESKAISIYQKYLSEYVAPLIPVGGTVIIHGHTDIIGDASYNHDLSHDRATEVRNILVNGLSKLGRSDVVFEVYGFGEDTDIAPFDNNYPEERFYNRTVVIDIIPTK